MLSRINFLFAAATLLLILLVAASASASSLLHRSMKRNNKNKKQKLFGNDPSYIFENANFSGAVSFSWPSTNPSNNKTTSWRKNFGYSNEEFKIPMPEHPSYPIASNTKLYIAISLYQLHERGLIKSMDDSIANYLDATDFQKMGVPSMTKYCPKLASDPNATGCQIITFRQLLGMSSGLQNLGLQWLPYPGTLAQVAGWHLKATLEFVPGSPSPQNSKFRNYYYSNNGFELCAYFVEKFSKMHLNAYLTRYVFSVVGLENTYFDPYNGKFQLNPERVGEFYKFIDNDDQTKLLGLGKVSSEFDLGSASGAGGIVSKQPDEEKLYRFLFSNFSSSAPVNKLLSHESIMAIVTPFSYIQENFFYAQGMFVIAPEDPSLQPTDFGNGRIPKTNPPVAIITYEGEIMGSHTSNFMMLQYDPPAIGQVWSSVLVFYPTKEQYADAQVNRDKNFFEIIGSWGQQAGLGGLAQDLIQFFLGEPPRN